MHRNDYGGKDSSAERIEALEQQVRYLRNELALSKESYLDLQRHLEEAAWDREILIKLMQNLGRHYLESAIKVTRSDGLGALSGNLGIVLRKFIDTKKLDMIAEERNKMQSQPKIETSVSVSLSLASLEESPTSSSATADPRTRARRNSLLLAHSQESMIGTSGGSTDEQNAQRDTEPAQTATAISTQAESSAQVGPPEPDSNVIEVAELMKLLTRDELMSLKAAASRQYSEWLENQLMQERIQCVAIAPLDSKPDPEAITTMQRTLDDLQAQFSGFTKSMFNATKRFLENVTDICNMSGDDDKWKIAYELTHRSALIAPSLDNGETDKLVALLQKAFDLVERKLTDDATQLEATYVAEAGSPGRTSVSNQHFVPISPARPHRTSLGNGSPAQKQTSPVAGLQVTPTRMAARKQKSAVIEDPTPLLFKPQYFKSQFVPHTNFITSCSQPESPLTPNIKSVQQISSPPTPSAHRQSDVSKTAMTARSDNSDSNSVLSAEVSPITSPFSVHQPSRRATPSLEALKAITNACPLPPHQQRQRQPLHPSPLQALRMAENSMRRRSTGYIRLESVDVQRLEELEV
eukprot:GILJ01004698.1.p1 GENE.GILJ01004698.1~~GILJ01004698.1.p1  ORF type:complete len:644 (+),score=95.87 GILJ01004698.1:195-1934(+)